MSRSRTTAAIGIFIVLACGLAACKSAGVAVTPETSTTNPATVTATTLTDTPGDAADHFDEIIVIVESLEARTEKLKLDIEDAETFVFDTYDMASVSQAEFEDIGTDWLAFLGSYFGEYRSAVLSDEATLRSLKLSQDRERIVRTEALRHFDAWTRFTSDYYDVVESWFFDTSTPLNFHDHYSAETKAVGSEIRDSFGALCLALGDAQPDSMVYQPRIQDICDD